MKKSLIITSILGLVSVNVNAQCPVVDCPGDTTITATAGSCESIFNYDVPVGFNECYVSSDTFNFTGAQEQFLVPNNVDTIYIEAFGAQGNSNANGVLGGMGGFAEGALPVSAGQIIYVTVGGGGNVSMNGGFNGGGDAGNCPTPSSIGGGGGGASDIRVGGTTLNDRVLVAAGGSGAGGDRTVSASRGTGGGGGAGYYGGGGGAGWGSGGSGLAQPGTQSAGGNGAVSSQSTMYDGEDGALGVGGNGGGQPSGTQAGSSQADPGAAGGGLVGAVGTYGSTWTGSSGAGGSSYIGGVLDSATQTGVRSGNGQVIISWYGEELASNQISGLSSGDTYPEGTTTNTFEVTDNNGNTASCSFDVTVISNIDTSVTTSGIDLTASNDNAGVTYQWIDCSDNSNIVDATDQSYTATENGDYAVVIDENGCVDTSSCYNISTVSIDQNYISNSINIHPNPTSDGKVVINLNDKYSNIEVNVSDIQGRIIYSQKYSQKQHIEINIENENGVYFFNINTPLGNTIERVVIQK